MQKTHIVVPSNIDDKSLINFLMGGDGLISQPGQ